MANEVSTSRKYDPSLVLVEFTPTGALQYKGLTEKGLALVREIAAKGYSHESIARRLGISKEGWRALRERCPEVQEAYEAGRTVIEEEVNDTILGHMRAGQLNAAIFYAKGRLGWRETGPQDPAQGQGTTVNITLTTPAAPGDIAKLIGQIPPEEDQ